MENNYKTRVYEPSSSFFERCSKSLLASGLALTLLASSGCTSLDYLGGKPAGLDSDGLEERMRENVLNGDSPGEGIDYDWFRTR